MADVIKLDEHKLATVIYNENEGIKVWDLDNFCLLKQIEEGK